MSRRWAAALGVVGLLGIAACSTDPVEDPAVVRADLLPEASDFPPGTVVEPLVGEEQMVLNLKLDAPSTGTGLESAETFEPPACEGENRYSDEARIRLIEDGSASGALLGDDRAYIMLVSETDLDVSRVADAHTGSCASYTVTFDDPTVFARTVRTERLALPPALATENAVVLSEVTESANPNWADKEILLGYATVDDYTVMVLGYQGAQFRDEFDDVFTRVVDKVRRGA